jgi:hypothetical protein
MTSTGLLIIPLSFLINLLPWRFSIIALLVFATLDSAAVVNAGSFGLQPGYFFGLLIIARTVVEITALRTPLNAHVIRMLMPLFLFTMICFISIWVGLTFFQGKIMVISGAAGFNLNLAQPYMFQRQNLTQPFYLVLNVATVYALAHQIVRLPADVVAVTLERAVLGALALASLVALWEMAHFYFGLPFFHDFFHSNAGYFAAHGQVLFGEVPRISGASSEPAGLAYQFAAFLMYAWYRYLAKPSTGGMGVVLLCITILAVSTSTTGFLILGLFALVVIKDLMVSLATRARFTLSLRHFGVMALLGSAVVGAYLFVQSHWYEIDGVVTSILLEKHQSSSFEERSAADRMAIDIALDTGGIGIGLGSHKPNNLIMTLLSNTGIAGCLLFASFLFELFRPRRIPAAIVDVRPYRWMIVGLLAVHAISNPNLNPLILWIGFALVIGALSVNRTVATDLAPGGKPDPSWGVRALAPAPIHGTSLRRMAARSTAV